MQKEKEDIFIGVVASSGARTPECSGLFKFDPIHGYQGKLLLTSIELPPGGELFDLPKYLNQKTLYCLIDGANFATIIYPDFSGGHRINNFVARIVDLRIRHIIRGIHIGEDEQEIKTIVLNSPIVARLFHLQAFNTQFETSPFKISIQYSKQDDRAFACNLGRALVGIFGTYSPEGESLAPALRSSSYIKIELQPFVKPIEAIRIVRKVEHLLSLLAFDFILAEGVSFGIECPDADGKKTEQMYEVERAQVLEDAKLTIERHKISLDLSDKDFGACLNKFLEIYDKIEQTLNWYRIVTAEKRYLEDKFFYCVRMIEALYKSLRIINADTEDSNSALPPSLAEIISRIKGDYSAEIRATEILDTKKINKLRGIEAHGSHRRFTPGEYQFMAYAYDVLRFIYPIVVLEYCGLERSFLLSSLKRGHAALYFAEVTLDQYKKNLSAK